jgi:hypothetical protein
VGGATGKAWLMMRWHLDTQPEGCMSFVPGGHDLTQ